MGAQRTTFEKLQRDRAKKAKAAMKRERRQERGPDGTTQAPVTEHRSQGELSAAELLERIERIHADLARGTITQDDFEEQKADLLARLPVD